MARPNSLPWNVATFTGSVPVSRLSDNFNSDNNVINDSGAGFVNYAVDTGSVNNYVVTLASAPLAYASGMCVTFTPANSNTGASVINVNSLGNVSIVNPANIALQGGELTVNATCVLVFDGTSFRILSPCSVSVSFPNVTTNKTLTCTGYNSVSVFLTVNSNFAPTLTLSHLSYGVPVFIYMANTFGSALTFKVAVTDPTGTALNVLYKFSGGSGSGTNMTTTGLIFASGYAAYASGQLVAGSSFLLMVAN